MIFSKEKAITLTPNWHRASQTVTTVLSLGIIGISTTLFSILPVEAATIWSGSKMTFTKATGADFTLSQNQDRITDNVWITRGDLQGLFNIKQESSFDKGSSDPASPVGTEWSYGTTANLGSLTFSKWRAWAVNNPVQTVGQDAVLHLIAEDIYIDIKFLSWDQRAGGFSYERSTEAVPEPTSTLGFLVLGSFGTALTLKRKLKFSKLSALKLAK
jgi:hypothetical protein